MGHVLPLPVGWRGCHRLSGSRIEAIVGLPSTGHSVYVRERDEVVVVDSFVHDPGVVECGTQHILGHIGDSGFQSIVDSHSQGFGLLPASHNELVYVPLRLLV
jgi:hypothetical protein